MSGSPSQVIEPRVLLEGLAIGESPRWHDDRLWFSNWGTGEIIAVDLDGNSEVAGRVRRLHLGVHRTRRRAGTRSRLAVSVRG
jgi:sugar lactone lactonase YvrE